MRFGLFLAVFVFFTTVVFVEPQLASAQVSLAEYAGCSGTDCSACNAVDLTNGIIKWLIGFLFLIFAVILTYAGVGLVTSGGNHHSLDEAKNRFVNALIGLMIVLAAWLIVDTIMRGLVGREGAEGKIPNGEVSGWLFWNEVQCYTQATTTAQQWIPKNFEPNTFWPGDSGSAGGQIVSQSNCAATPAGNVNCTAAEASCRSQGFQSIIDKSNPTNYQVSCVKLTGTNGAEGTGNPGTGSTGCAGGACVPLTIPCSNARSCSIAADMVGRLEGMHKVAGVTGARVTEAMPPTRTHKSTCHTNGTCIDYSKSGGMSGAEVARVVSAASNNGLRAVYEVVTDAQKAALVQSGAPANSIIVLGNHISAPHFSIYGY